MVGIFREVNARLIYFIFFVSILYYLTSCSEDDPPDLTSPNVTDFIPEDLSRNNLLYPIIFVAFNEPIDETTISGNFTLMQADSVIPSSTNYLDSTNTIMLNPNQDLLNGMEYVVQLSDSITDLAGNMVDAMEWSFYTISRDTARYELTFAATWSAETHPIDFPAGAHWSGLIGMTHNETASLYVEGELASLGIKSMAETGSKVNLTTEINQMISDGNALSLVSGPGINPSPGSGKVEIVVEKKFPLISVTTMIAPSPDWYVAIPGINLMENELWRDAIEVGSAAYDAGTDSGLTFTSANLVTDPPVNIFKITEAPLAEDGEVASMGVFKLVRIQ